MQHVWLAFSDLRPTRQIGMTVGPITWAEINAYEAATLFCLSVWDKRMIRRMDDASQAILTGTKPKPTNIASLKSALRGVIAERAAKAAAKKGSVNV